MFALQNISFMIISLHYEAQLSSNGTAYPPCFVLLSQEQQEVINMDLISV